MMNVNKSHSLDVSKQIKQSKITKSLIGEATIRKQAKKKEDDIVSMLEQSAKFGKVHLTFRGSHKTNMRKAIDNNQLRTKCFHQPNIISEQVSDYSSSSSEGSSMRKSTKRSQASIASVTVKPPKHKLTQRGAYNRKELQTQLNKVMVNNSYNNLMLTHTLEVAREDGRSAQGEPKYRY